MEPHTIERMISILSETHLLVTWYDNTIVRTHPVHMNSENVIQVKSDRALSDSSLLVLIAAQIPVLNQSQPRHNLSRDKLSYKLPQPSNPHNAILFLKSVLRFQTSVTGNRARKKSIAACMLAP